MKAKVVTQTNGICFMNNGQKKKKTKGQVLTPTVTPKVVSVYWYQL
jgi:hypothetical protein